MIGHQHLRKAYLAFDFGDMMSGQFCDLAIIRPWENEFIGHGHGPWHLFLKY